MISAAVAHLPSISSGDGVLHWSNEEVFRALAAHTLLGVFLLSADGGCVYVNDRFCELAGLTVEQALGHGWSTAIHPDDRQCVLDEWAEATRTGSEAVVEYRVIHPDGRIAWIQSTASSMRDEDGHVTSWVGSCLDATPRMRAEEAAAQSSARSQVAFESAPNGVALVGLNGCWLAVNDALCSMTGYSSEELLSLSFSEITHPDDREASDEDWIRHTRGVESSSRSEERYVRSDGQIVWVAVTKALVRDADGSMLYTVTHTENITGRREAQRSLADAEERLRRAFDDALIGMALVGLDGRWQQANPALCALLGYSESELLALTVRDLTHPDDVDEGSDRLRSLVDGDAHSFVTEKRYRHKNGTDVWTKLSVSLVRDAADVPLYFIGQVEDIRDAKLAEAETERVLKREHEHVERLRALDALKDELVASVSHELRTPLTSIMGYLELVLDGSSGEVNEEQRAHLETISRNGERLLRLVGDLLFVGQTDAGKLELFLSQVDLRTLAIECVESAGPCAAAKRIGLDLSAEELPLFQGDCARLAQLFDNLVSNAIKFTPEGGAVSVSLMRSSGSAVFEVCDTGIGIGATEREQIFERFFRTSGATDRAIQGTGLGLSIARTIAESHGGQISLESVEGVGTTFKVTLPFGCPATVRIAAA